MFASWAALLWAAAVAFLFGALSSVLAYIPDRTGLLTSLASRSTKLEDGPTRARDLRYGIIGQQREDSRRRRRSVLVLLATLVAVQLIPVGEYLAAAITLVVFLATSAIHWAYDNILVNLLDDTLDAPRKSLRGEVSQFSAAALAPRAADPFRGYWRLVGLSANAVSVVIALLGWAYILTGLGVHFRDHAAIINNTLLRDRLLSCAAGLTLVLLARIPTWLARTLALTHSKSAEFDVVYLRSFRDDRLRIRVRGSSRSVIDRITLQHRHGYERLLVASLDLLGSVVALSEPGVKIPPVGAFRLSFEHDNWEAQVDNLLRNARFIVLSLGSTPSVQLEIAKIRDMGILDRALFVIPPVDATEQRARLSQLCTILDVDSHRLLESWRPLVEYVGVAFDDGSANPVVAASYDYVAYHNAVLDLGFSAFDRTKPSAIDSFKYADTLIDVLEFAASRRNGWPLDTYQILCALIERDSSFRWRTLLSKSVEVDWTDYQARMDRPASIAGYWRNVPLTAHSVSALRMSQALIENYEIDRISGAILGICLVANPTSAASRTLLQASATHAELLRLMQDELLGGTLEGY